MSTKKNNLQACFSLAAIFFMHPLSAQAQSIDPLIEGAKLCTRHLQHYETTYGIPAHLLSAIASTESGRYHTGLKIKLPWPWTINAAGKGYYYDSKEEAVAAAHKFYASGIESMDVGCMQVNLYHHSKAFSSLSQAFEPQSNIAYAASFLRNLYQEDGSWKKAASNYHSKTPHLGTKYVGLVYDSWFKIVDKLRSARLSVPSSSVNGLREMQRADSIKPNQPAPSGPKYIQVSKKEDNDISAYKSPSMKSIKVSSVSFADNNKTAKKRENGVLVINPEITVASNKKSSIDTNPAPEPMVIADATPLTPKQSVLDMAPSAGSNNIEHAAPSNTPQAKIIRLDNNLVDRRPVNDVVRKAGPNFIFND